jgi:hypothetical protein
MLQDRAMYLDTLPGYIFGYKCIQQADVLSSTSHVAAKVSFNPASEKRARGQGSKGKQIEPLCIFSLGIRETEFPNLTGSFVREGVSPGITPEPRSGRHWRWR